ncbi:hypothetical protein, partial [Klebsiella pneumoniae]
MQHPSKPLAKTRQGTLAGSAEQGIHIWRGIPYLSLIHISEPTRQAE